MKTNRKNQLARLHILLEEQGIDEDTKREIYATYGVASAAYMTDYQLAHLIGQLEGRNMGAAPVVKARQDVGPETRRLRSQCLTIITGNPDAADPRKRGLGIPNDWAIINPFVQNHAGARLNQLSDGSLGDLAKKLRAIRDSGWRYRTKETAPAPVAPVFVMPANPKNVN